MGSATDMDLDEIMARYGKGSIKKKPSTESDFSADFFRCASPLTVKNLNGRLFEH